MIPLGNAIEEDIYVFPQSVLIPTDAHGKVRCVLRRANAETLISTISSRQNPALQVCSCYQRKPPAKWSATHTTNL